MNQQKLYSFTATRVKISLLVNKMCSHCLFSVVNKSGITCCHHEEANRLATSCSNKSDIVCTVISCQQVDDNKLVATCSQNQSTKFQYTWN
jgi:hypothetical protein